MIFPKHDCGLYLEHNAHKDYYETAEQAIKKDETNDCQIQWIDGDEKLKAIQTNEIWTLQWYPNTPISFNLIGAATLEALLEFANSKEFK